MTRSSSLHHLTSRGTPMLIAAALAAGACAGPSSGVPGENSAVRMTGDPSGVVDGTRACDAARGASIGYSQPIADETFQYITAAMAHQMQLYGVSLQTVNANLDPVKQVSDIDTLLSQGVRVVIANPVDPNATKPVFDRARQQNIPVVVQDTSVGGPYFSDVATDQEGAAAQGAKLLKATVGDGEVTSIQGPSFAEALSRRNQSFAQTAGSIGLHVVDTQVNQQITPQAAQEIAAGWKTRFGSGLSAIWTFNDVTAIGAASAYSGGATPPAIIGADGEPQVIPLIRAGTVLATYDIQFELIGKTLAYAAVSALCGQSVPSEIIVPVRQVDRSNVDSYRQPTDRIPDAYSPAFEQVDGRTFLKQ